MLNLNPAQSHVKKAGNKSLGRSLLVPPGIAQQAALPGGALIVHQGRQDCAHLSCLLFIQHATLLDLKQSESYLAPGLETAYFVGTDATHHSLM